MRLFPLSVLFAACKGGSGSDDPAVGPGTIDVGDMIELDVADDGTVTLDVDTAGTYRIVLFSQATEQATLYGYGEVAGAARMLEPSDPLPLPDRSGPPTTWAAEGDTRMFTVYDGRDMVDVEAEVVMVTDEAVVWKDITTTSRLGDVDADTLADVLELFEDFVLPRTRQVFGEISDVDENGQVDVLISYTVNTYGAVAYVSQCDIADFFGCGVLTNGGETIYMAIPDPSDSYSTAPAIVELFAHELNHLVYAWNKYVGNDDLSPSENIYLTEGMSELAQDLTGFNNGNQYIWASAIDMRDYYGDEDSSTQGVSINDFLRGSSYYDYDRDGPLRGGAYLFLRYLFEQQGGMSVGEMGEFTDEGGIAFLHDWFTAPEQGADCVEATTGLDLLEVAFDWYTALLLSGSGLSDDPRYSYAERIPDPMTGYEYGVNTHANVHGWLQLNGPPVQALEDADGRIRAGGVEYLEVVVDGPTRLEIPVDPDALPRARAIRVE